MILDGNLLSLSKKPQVNLIKYAMYFQHRSLLAVHSIVSCEQLDGKKEWRVQAMEMLAGAMWEFNSDGTFLYSPAYGRKELFPLQGNYIVEQDQVLFQGVKTLSESDSIVSSWCLGRIDCRVDPMKMYLDWGSAVSNAVMVVNCLFDSQHRSFYRAVILLQQVTDGKINKK